MFEWEFKVGQASKLPSSGSVGGSGAGAVVREAVIKGSKLNGGMTRVLITDAQERAVLAACRSLGRRGYVVDAAASERPAVTHWSRFCANRLWISDPRAHPAEFVRELSRIVSGGAYDVLIPGTDASMLALSRGREQVEPFVKVGLPAHEIVERSLSKVDLVELAAQAGIPAPESVVCTEPNAALEAARRFGYPVMLKSGDVVFERDGELRGSEARWFTTSPRSSGCFEYGDRGSCSACSRAPCRHSRV